MKHTIEEIIEKAKSIMNDIDGEYYSESAIQKPFFKQEDEIISGKHSGETTASWVVGVDSLFDNVDFLHISDETGEPIYYQNFNTFTFDIDKDKDGKYFLVKDD